MEIGQAKNIHDDPIFLDCLPLLVTTHRAVFKAYKVDLCNILDLFGFKGDDMNLVGYIEKAKAQKDDPEVIDFFFGLLNEANLIALEHESMSSRYGHLAQLTSSDQDILRLHTLYPMSSEALPYTLADMALNPDQLDTMFKLGATHEITGTALIMAFQTGTFEQLLTLLNQPSLKLVNSALLLLLVNIWADFSLCDITNTLPKHVVLLFRQAVNRFLSLTARQREIAINLVLNHGLSQLPAYLMLELQASNWLFKHTFAPEQTCLICYNSIKYHARYKCMTNTANDHVLCCDCFDSMKQELHRASCPICGPGKTLDFQLSSRGRPTVWPGLAFPESKWL